VAARHPADMAAPPPSEVRISKNLGKLAWYTACEGRPLMTEPRKVTPGMTCMLTRNAGNREMRLVPTPVLTQLVKYALAIYADFYGIQVHAYCVMSSHIHIIVTDVRGSLPDFLREFHRSVSENARGVVEGFEDGPFWDHRRTSVVHLVTRAAVIEKIAYTLANPVKAGLVEHGHEWPGGRSVVDDMGSGEIRAARPAKFYGTYGLWPEEGAVAVSIPPMIEADEVDLFRRQVAEELARQEQLGRSEWNGRPPLGAEKAMKVKPTERVAPQKRYQRNPTFAIGGEDKDTALLKLTKEAVRAFRKAYHTAMNIWKKDRSVFFPPGTWWMRVFHGVNVSEDGPALRSG
jgi:REP element-mobilizing transposase RayT